MPIYDTYADLVAANIPTTVQFLQAGIYRYRRGDPLEENPAAVSADGAKWIPERESEISTGHFGAVGNGDADDTQVVQKAIDYFKSVISTRSAHLYLMAAHKITDSLDFTHTGGERCMVTGPNGPGLPSCTIVVGYHGYGTNAKPGAVFQMGDPDAPESQTPIGVSGILFETAGSVFQLPIFLDQIAPAQSACTDVTFGSSNNTVWRVTGPQNCIWKDMRSFSGGKSYPYKDASGVTVTQSGTTLTASSAIFDTEDVGRTIAIWGQGSSSYRRKTEITQLISHTQVVVTDHISNDTTAYRLLFGSPYASLSAGLPDITIDSEVGLIPDNSLEGIWLIFKGAGIDGVPFRAKVTGQSNNEIKIDRPAPVSISGIEFATATVEFLSDPNLPNGPSDNDVIDGQIENYNGYGLYCEDHEIFSFNGKIHTEQSATTDRYSLEGIIANRWEGEFDGSLDGQSLSKFKIYATNQNATLRFPNLRTRFARGDRLLEIGPKQDIGGLVLLGNIEYIVDPNDPGLLSDIIVDSNANNSGHVLFGVSSTNTLDDLRISIGDGVDVTNSGDISTEGSISVGSAVTLDPATGDYTFRIGPDSFVIQDTDVSGFYGVQFKDKSGAVDAELRVANGGQTLTLLSGGVETLVLDNGQVIAPNLPTSSTGLASGALWTDNGTVKIV